MVKKTGSDRVILHFVNYNVPLKDVHVTVNLDGIVKQIDRQRIQLLSPDGGVKPVNVIAVRGTQVELILPELQVYDVVTIN